MIPSARDLPLSDTRQGRCRFRVHASNQFSRECQKNFGTTSKAGGDALPAIRVRPYKPRQNRNAHNCLLCRLRNITDDGRVVNGVTFPSKLSGEYRAGFSVSPLGPDRDEELCQKIRADIRWVGHVIERYANDGRFGAVTHLFTRYYFLTEPISSSDQVRAVEGV